MGDGNPNIPVPVPPLQHPLTHLTAALARNGWAKIVAIGSSTTAGEGGITPYPERLERALRGPRPNERPIIVLNRGNGGEDAPDELKRLQRDVIDERPAMVIWQVGTNTVWNGDSLKLTVDAISEGLDLLGDRMDIVLMDPQYVPALLTPDRIGPAKSMVALIADAAANAKAPVSVFQRFAYMQAWKRVERISFDRMLDPTDNRRLHHSDWSTQRIADALCQVMQPLLPPVA
jgi:hypothetical protein